MFEWQVNHMVDLDNFAKIMRVLPVNELTYHVHGSFGDVYIQLSALKELLEEKDEVFHILIDEKYGLLADQALGSKIGKFHINGNIVNNTFNKVGLIGKTGNLPLRLLPTLYPECSNLILSKRLRYSDFLRGIIDSKKTGFFSKIEDKSLLKQQAEDIIKNSGCIPGETIVISLDNNTHLEFSADFWIRIVEIINGNGISILLNDSGTLNFDGANLLSNTNLPRIKIAPQMAVTIPSIAGGYIGGTNGFSTIQALFNDEVPGLHFINAIESHNNIIIDKFGTKYDEGVMFHSNLYTESFRNNQIEVLVKKTTSQLDLYNLLIEYIKLIKSNVKK
jgi:hypothetical protein